MNIHYTGRQVELSEAQKKKLDLRFQKIHNILGKRHAPEAHVILSLERHLHNAEVTLHYQHHTMVVQCSSPDVLTAAQDAVEKLEKQIIRNKDKWREKKRRAKPLNWEGPERAEKADGQAGAGVKVYRDATRAAKPLTIEEAILEMEQDDRDYVVYQDADKGRQAVLFRRRDGNLQLFEA